jgi:putative membrane-bound dehydrogenase-like protein
MILALSEIQAAEPPPAVKSPLSVENSLKAFRLSADLKIEIVAAEPQVVSPVSIAFDEGGRLWVVEMSDYPNGPAPGEPPKSRIKLLEDLDADGRFETAHIFADKLLFATGVQPWRGGVIVTLAGEIAYFKDTDGDNRADVRETWYRGFVQENPQLRANHPRFALDNYVYVANGLKGGTIVADREKWGRDIPSVNISGKDFRFDPLTGDCEAVSGNGQFGLTFDDFGNRFVCTNRNPCRHVVLEDRYLKRNPFLAVRDVCQDVSPPAEKSRIFPISRAWTTSNLHAGQFTAACGLLINRGDGLPLRFDGNSFVCEPTGNLVHRDILEPDGPTFKSHYGDGDVEFLASPDEWFRPVDLANGPDGALYVVDMYRAVIEHPEWVPAELKNRPDLYDGSDRGRIYRVVSQDRPIDLTRRGALKLGSLPVADLAGVIEHPNAWHRETAARLLFERQDKSIAVKLDRIARSRSKSAAVRMHALSLLNALHAVSDDLLVSLAADTDEQVIDYAMCMAETRLQSSRALCASINSGRSGISFQIALSLGELDLSQDGNSGGLNKLAALLVEHPENEWYRRAALSSATNSGLLLFSAITQDPVYVRAYPKVAKYCRLIEDVHEVIGSSAEEFEILPALGNAIPSLGRDPDDIKRLYFAIVNGLGRGTSRRGKSLRDLLDRFDEKKLAFEGSKPLFDEAVWLAEAAKAQIDLRLEAIKSLQYAPFKDARPVLLGLIQTDPSQEIRLAAIDALASFDDATVAASLLTTLLNATPAVRRRVLQSLLKTTSRSQALLAEIESGRIALSDLDPVHVQMLTNHKFAEIREPARRLLAAAIPADRKQVLEAYQPALAVKADARRGRAVFEKNCVTCHKIGDLGIDVAPDISDSRTKTPAQLLNDILNPNQAIDSNYVSYTVATRDGKAETGIIATETATSITLRQPEGKTVLILRQEIEEMKSNGVSLMPEGLEKNISVEQMADLILFIKNWRYLDGAVPLGK